jgi:hypothetical protein
LGTSFARSRRNGCGILAVLFWPRSAIRRIFFPNPSFVDCNNNEDEENAMLRIVGSILVAIVVVTGIWSFWPEREETVAPATETTSTAAAPAAPAAPAADNVPAPSAEPGTAAAPASDAKPAETQTAQASEQSAPAPAEAKPPAPAADEAKPAGDAAKPAGDDKPAGDAAPAAGAPAGGGAAADEGGNPKETAEKAEKGSLKNPNADPLAVAEAGQKVYMSAGCNGCHGGTGGGGMGPPLSNEIWVYGSDDDTLFRLIALGSDGLKAQGYNRKGSEAVVGPMPPHGGIVKSNGDMWKIISWIRKINPSSGG